MHIVYHDLGTIRHSGARGMFGSRGRTVTGNGKLLSSGITVLLQFALTLSPSRCSNQQLWTLVLHSVVSAVPIGSGYTGANLIDPPFVGIVVRWVMDAKWMLVARGEI